jgi:hypothetical protein
MVTTHMGSSSPSAQLTGLTWDGHEFAAMARDDTAWRNAMGIVQEQGGAVGREPAHGEHELAVRADVLQPSAPITKGPRGEFAALVVLDFYSKDTVVLLGGLAPCVDLRPRRSETLV